MRQAGIPTLGLALAASLGLAAPGRAFEEPVPLEQPDAAAELRMPAALGDGAATSVRVRIRNAGLLPVHLADVELLARWADGSPAGEVSRVGRLPDLVDPGRSAWAHFRWWSGTEVPPDEEPVLFSGCVSIQETDADPTNDCDLALRGRLPRTETLRVEDAFDEQAPYWEWWRSGTGVHEVVGGIAELTITEASHAGEYSDSEINDYRRGPERGFPWTPGMRVEIRARASDDNGLRSANGKGTRGFGLWNLATGGAGGPEGMTNAWFISISKETFGGGFGLFAATVFDRGQVVLLQPIAVDMRQWHTYGIVWTPRGVTFSVDRRPVAATPHAPQEALGFVAWIDNYRLSFDGGGIETGLLDLDRDQTLFVDQVRIWSLGGSSVPTPVSVSASPPN